MQTIAEKHGHMFFNVTKMSNGSGCAVIDVNDGASIIGLSKALAPSTKTADGESQLMYPAILPLRSEMAPNHGSPTIRYDGRGASRFDRATDVAYHAEKETRRKIEKNSELERLFATEEIRMLIDIQNETYIRSIPVKAVILASSSMLNEPIRAIIRPPAIRTADKDTMDTAARPPKNLPITIDTLDIDLARNNCIVPVFLSRTIVSKLMAIERKGSMALDTIQTLEEKAERDVGSMPSPLPYSSICLRWVRKDS
jgi:hypothetical protein